MQDLHLTSLILHECLIHVQFSLCDHWESFTPKSDDKKPMRIPCFSLNPFQPLLLTDTNPLINSEIQWDSFYIIATLG